MDIVESLKHCKYYAICYKSAMKISSSAKLNWSQIIDSINKVKVKCIINRVNDNVTNFNNHLGKMLCANWIKVVLKIRDTNCATTYFTLNGGYFPTCIFLIFNTACFADAFFTRWNFECDLQILRYLSDAIILITISNAVNPFTINKANGQ